jgi:hypothetical protein
MEIFLLKNGRIAKIMVEGRNGVGGNDAQDPCAG